MRCYRSKENEKYSLSYSSMTRRSQIPSIPLVSNPNTASVLVPSRLGQARLSAASSALFNKSSSLSSSFGPHNPFVVTSSSSSSGQVRNANASRSVKMYRQELFAPARRGSGWAAFGFRNARNQTKARKKREEDTDRNTKYRVII